MDLHPVTGLRAALPYLRLFRDQLFVLKCGGEACESPEILDSIIEQIALLHQVGIRILLVHGGGVQATELGEKLGIETSFVDGRRVTSEAAIDTMIMALNGTARTAILSACRRHGLPAVGVSGIDSGIIQATRKEPIKVSSGDVVDFGQVGKINAIDPEPLLSILYSGAVPILTPLSADENGTVLNINADDIAAAVAGALGAAKLIILTQPRGILTDLNDPQSLISQVTLDELAELEKSGTVKTGMLPKIKAIRTALENGVQQVHVISHAFPDSILTEVFTNEGCGTMILPEESE